MKRYSKLTLITIITIFFGLNVISADDLANKFSHWLEIEESNAKQIVAKFILPPWPKHKDITQDNITYKLYDFEEGFFFLEDEGKPRLPVKYVSFQVPDDADNFNVEIIDSKTKVKDSVIIYPAPQRYFEKNKEGMLIEKEKFSKDEKFYSQDIWYPNKPAEVEEVAFVRQLKMIQLAIYPMLFNPKQKQIKQFTSLRLRITYTSNKQRNEVIVDTNTPYHKMFKNIIPNYSYRAIETPQRDGLGGQEDRIYILDQQDIINPNPGFNIDYLVIAADTFYDNIFNSNLYDLCQHRALDYTIGIASVYDIYGQYLGDGELKEKSIKDFIQFAYDNWRSSPEIPELDFVLLVGDADYGFSNQNWFVPTWRSTEEMEGTTSDNDYACVSGNDFRPDLMIGRLPVKNETELNNIVSKTIYFETHPPQGQNNWGTRNLYLSGNDEGIENWAGPLNSNTRDMLISNHQEIEEMITEDPPYGYTSESAAGYINNQGALIVTYEGHGWIEEWWPTVEINDLNNPGQYPAVVFSFACSTAFYDYAPYNCYGEEWIKLTNSGSLAFFGSSRVAYSYSFEFIPLLLNTIYDEGNYLLGSAIQQVKTEVSLGNSYYTGPEIQRHNLLGDPAVNLSNHIEESAKAELSFDIYFSDQEPLVGEEIRINMEIENVGLSSASNILIQLFEEINGQLVQIGNNQIIDTLEGNSSTILWQPWTYDGRPCGHFVLRVDPADTIDELSDYNNHSMEDIYFYFSPVYVDDSNDSGIENGSFEHPFNTIPEALNYAEDNRAGEEILTINVMEGTYDGYNTLFIPDYTYLKGLGNIDHIIIKDKLVNLYPHVTVEHLTIDLDYYPYEPNYNLFRNGNVIDNVFRHCVIAAEVSEQASFKNNIFYENNTAMLIERPINASFYLTNNTFINNDILLTDDDDFGYLELNLRNNIIRGNGPASFYGNTTIYADYNNSDDETILNAGINNINSNPLFANEAMYDFTLLPSSPCVNRGDPNPIYNDPDGSRNDMGAYGGPNAQIPEPSITVRFPQEGQVINSLIPTIRWDTSGGIQPNENLRLVISHFGTQAEPQPQHSSLKSSFQRILSKIIDFFAVQPAYAVMAMRTIIDLDVIVPNTGSYRVPQGILSEDISYTLKLSQQTEPDINDIVHFSVSLIDDEK